MKGVERTSRCLSVSPSLERLNDNQTMTDAAIQSRTVDSFLLYQLYWKKSSLAGKHTADRL